MASYNVENLFDASFQGTEYKAYLPSTHHWNKKMAEVKLNHTAEVLCDLDADIVALQEIENDSVLCALQKRLKKVGCNYPYRAITHKRGATIQVALLSRFKLGKQRELVVNPSPHVRNILEVEAHIEGYRLTLFVNHWKSKGRRGVESKRIASAKVLQKRIMALPKERAYLIIGDLNSNYDAYLSLAKKLNDTKGKTGINHILKTLSHQRLLTKSDIQRAEKGWHYNLWCELPFNKRWSHRFYGHRSSLDHILIPASLLDGKGIDYVNHSFRVFKASYLFTKKGYINSWQLKHGKHTGKGYSDHLPVVATFDTKPFLPSPQEIPIEKERVGTIDSLYSLTQLKETMVLKDVVVVFKRGRYGVIKQTPHGRGIFIFGILPEMKEGKKFDVRVEEISTYQGLKEITALVILKEKGRVDITPFYASLKRKRQNEVLRDLVGSYQKGYFYTKGQKIPLYFRKRSVTPKNGTKIKIAYAHLGYYKKLQLVIYSKKDFTILEK